MFIRSNSGFSIVGVLVAFVLAGLLSVLLAKTIGNAQKGQNTVVNSVEFSVLKSSIKFVLDDPDLCDTAFVSSGLPAVFTDSSAPYPSALQPFDSVKIGASSTSPIVAQTNKVLDGGLKLTSMGFRQMAPRDTVSVPGKFLYKVALEITASKGESYGGRTLSNSDNPFLLTIITAGTSPYGIEKCRVSATGAGAPLPPGPPVPGVDPDGRFSITIGNDHSVRSCPVGSVLVGMNHCWGYGGGCSYTLRCQNLPAPVPVPAPAPTPTPGP